MPLLVNPRLNTTQVVAAATVAATATLYWLQRQKQASSMDPINNGDGDDNIETIPLLPLEESMTMFQTVQGISTLTWYQGDIRTTQKQLRQRVLRILQANPWLTGRLIRASTGNVAMAFNKGDITDSSMDYHFQVLSAESCRVSRETPYDQLADLLVGLKCLIGIGADCLKNSSPYFRVSLLPDANEPQKRFALIVSQAHCVGDGHTFYTLHNMLDSKADIFSLNPQRKPEIVDKIATALGGPIQAASLADPPLGFLLRFVKGMIYSTIFGPPTVVKLYWINDEWIQQEKQLAAKGASSNTFVSTNDILTARLFQTAQVDQGIMAVNFRGKLDGCLETDAGNYFNYLVCRPSDYASPGMIRTAIQEIMGSTRQPKTNPMNSYQHITSKSLFGATTNWTTFYKPVVLEGGQQEIHIPVIPCDSVSAPSSFLTGLFLFKPTLQPCEGNRIAAMFAGHPNLLIALQKTGMLGPEVYK